MSAKEKCNNSCRTNNQSQILYDRVTVEPKKLLSHAAILAVSEIKNEDFKNDTLEIEQSR
jgi:hypothetical protein